MKIAVLGNIIDTENIYEITKVGFSEGCLEHQVHKGCYSNGFSFDIIQYGKLITTIGLSCQTYIAHDHIKDKVDKIRDKIITYWSQNQSIIPKLEFED